MQVSCNDWCFEWLTALIKNEAIIEFTFLSDISPSKKNTWNKTLKPHGRKVLKYLAGLLERVLAFQITWLKEKPVENGDVFLGGAVWPDEMWIDKWDGRWFALPSYSHILQIIPWGSFDECHKSLLSRASLWDGATPSPIERERER